MGLLHFFLSDNILSPAKAGSGKEKPEIIFLMRQSLPLSDLTLSCYKIRTERRVHTCDTASDR